MTAAEGTLTPSPHTGVGYQLNLSIVVGWQQNQGTEDGVYVRFEIVQLCTAFLDFVEYVVSHCFRCRRG